MTLSIGSLFFQILAFAILYLLLKKYAFGPLVGMMEKRRQSIEADINNAEKNRADAEQFLKEQTEELKKARLEAHEIIENAKAVSVKQANDIVEAAKTEAERLKEQAIQDIKLEKEKAVAELRDQVGVLSVMIASKIIEKELDQQGQAKLVDDMMKQVGESL